MSEPFLILHRVRGQPAFDIAHQMPCPLTPPHHDCAECNDTGYWWILSTCGYRAYPYWYSELHESILDELYDKMPVFMPENAPDCFACNDRPQREESYAVKAKAAGLLQSLGLIKKIERRL